MTGFAKVHGFIEDKEFVMEIKSVNSRSLDLKVKLPGFLSELELLIREFIASKVRRGTITFSLFFIDNNPYIEVNFNDDLFLNYYNKIKDSLIVLGVNEKPSIDTLLTLPNVITYKYKDLDIDEVFKIIESFLNTLIEEFLASRRKEGDVLYKDIKNRISKISEYTNKIEELIETQKDNIIKKLKENISLVLDDKQIDNNLILHEIGFILNKVDITEEIVRLRKHTQELESLLDKGGEVGKKASFILQEMNRETNTIASKSVLYDINKIVIDIKEEIEKIKEQMQNIE